MALHFALMVNTDPIGQVVITRTAGGSAPDDVNRYRWEYGQTATGRLEIIGGQLKHRYGDGALVLAHKVLSAIIDGGTR